MKVFSTGVLLPQAATIQSKVGLLQEKVTQGYAYGEYIVVARFRPPNKAEIASGGESIVDFETEDTCNVTVRSLLSGTLAL